MCCGILDTLAYVNTLFQVKFSFLQETFSSMVIPDSEHDTIAQKRVAQALTKITIFPQISQFGQISVEVLPLQLPTLVEFVPFICLIDISSKILVKFLNDCADLVWVVTLGTRGNSLAKSGRPKAGKTSVRSEVSEASEGPNASSLWWRTPMVLLCLIQILYLITDWLFKNVFLPATTVGQKRSREMNRFFQ